MIPPSKRNRTIKVLLGAALFLALAAAAAVVSLRGGGEPPTAEGLRRRVEALGGIGRILQFQFDNIEYNGQGAAKVVTIDFVVEPGARGEALYESMKKAGAVARDAVEVYQKIVITGHRERRGFDEGLPFAARAVWLAPELAAPLDGWMLLRLPDTPRPPAQALDGVYARPTVTSVRGGALSATVDLTTERLARHGGDIREILSLPLLDTFDFDNVFARSPALESIEVTVLDGGRPVARATMTRSAFAEASPARLRAEFSRTVLAIAAKEMALAEKYESNALFTPLLFEHVVAPEDRAAVAALREERHRAEEEFYGRLFAGGSLEVERFAGDGEAEAAPAGD